MANNYIYSDPEIDFSRNRYNNDASRSLDLNAIQQSVINIIMTSPREKPFSRDFGVGIQDLLFELSVEDDIAYIASEVERQLQKHEPRIKFQRIYFERSNFTVDMFVEYSVSLKSLGTVPLQTIKLTLEKVR